MERTLTQEERIRRAEEIYLRRRNEARPQYRETRQSVSAKHMAKPTGISLKLFKRMALQIVICLLLYCIFYLIYDTNYSFSDATISKTQEILNYDIDFDEIYKYINENIIKFENTEQTEIEENNEQENIENNVEEINNEAVVNEESTVQEIEPQPEEVIVEEVEQTSAQEPDLKQLYGLIRPVSRRICFFRIWRKSPDFSNSIRKSQRN